MILIVRLTRRGFGAGAWRITFSRTRSCPCANDATIGKSGETSLIVTRVLAENGAFRDRRRARLTSQQHSLPYSLAAVTRPHHSNHNGSS